MTNVNQIEALEAEGTATLLALAECPLTSFLKCEAALNAYLSKLVTAAGSIAAALTFLLTRPLHRAVHQLAKAGKRHEAEELFASVEGLHATPEGRTFAESKEHRVDLAAARSALSGYFKLNSARRKTA